MTWAQVALCQSYVSESVTLPRAPERVQAIEKDAWNRLILATHSSIAAYDGEAVYPIDASADAQLLSAHVHNEASYFLWNQAIDQRQASYRALDSTLHRITFEADVVTYTWSDELLVYQLANDRVYILNLSTWAIDEIPYAGGQLKALFFRGKTIYLFGTSLFTYHTDTQQFREEDIQLPRATEAVLMGEESFYVISSSGQLWTIRGGDLHSEYTSRIPLNTTIIAAKIDANQIIFVTDRQGIIIYNISSQNTTTLSGSDDLCFDRIAAGYIVNAHTIWTTDGRTLCLTKSQYPAIANKALGIRYENIQRAEQQGNAIYFSSDKKGVYRLKNNKIKHLGAAEGFVDKRVTAMTKGANGSILFAVPDAGIISYDARQNTFQSPAYPHAIDGTIQQICTLEDSHTLYITTSNGIWLAASAGVAPARATRLFPSRIANIVDAHQIGKRAVLLATPDKLFTYNHNDQTLKLFKDLTSEGGIRDMTVWNGNIYVLFRDKVISLPMAGSGDQAKSFNQAVLNIAPPYQTIHAVRDKIFISNRASTAAYPHEYFTIDRNENDIHSLPYVINKNALITTGKSLIAGTNIGLLYVDEHHSNALAPKLAFEAIHVNDKVLVDNKKSYSSDENRWEFHIAAINPEENTSPIIAWELSSQKQSLQGQTTDGMIRFPSLPPGNYTLSASTGGSASLTHSFSIAPKFADTFWFRVIASGILVGSLGLILFAWSRRRLHNIRKRNAELQARNELLELRQKALQLQMNPHFLFNALNSIQSLVGKDDKKARYYIAKLGKLMRATLEHAREKWITLDDEIQILQAYLDVEKLHHQFTCTIETNGINPTWKIPPMMLQPLIENAVKHGVQKLPLGDGKISITFELVGRKIRCTIRDNGPGFTTEASAHKSISTQVINERMALYASTGTFVDPIVYLDTEVGVAVYIGLPYLN